MVNFSQALLRLKEQVGVQTDKELAALLGLSATSFSDRKKRHSFPEDKLRSLAQKRPDLDIDVDYVLQGESDSHWPDPRATFSAVLDRIHECLGSPSRYIEAEDLGTSRDRLERWFDRQALPAYVLEQFAREHGVNLRWLKSGEGPMKPTDATAPVVMDEVASPQAEKATDSDPDIRAAIELIGDELFAQRKSVSGAELYALIQASQRDIRRERELKRKREKAREQGGKVDENLESKSHARSS